MRTIKLQEVDSTNSYLEREGGSMDAPVLVRADVQKSGRGQRGNHWESEPGKNLTFSVLYKPLDYPASEQFSISEATALATVDFLQLQGVEACVKWPNDIYVGDRKICGILIKHTLTGMHINSSILGIGININQTEFLSDAPNPVSLKSLTGRDYDLDYLTQIASECLEKRLAEIYGIRHRTELHNEFMCRLWRGDGRSYPFQDTASGETFEAAIDNIGLDGTLTLRLADDSQRHYRFKEIAFLIHNS